MHFKNKKTMKKTYISPQCEAFDFVCENMIAVSPGVTSEGGGNEDGSSNGGDACSNKRSIWDNMDWGNE